MKLKDEYENREIKSTPKIWSHTYTRIQLDIKAQNKVKFYWPSNTSSTHRRKLKIKTTQIARHTIKTFAWTKTINVQHNPQTYLGSEVEFWAQNPPTTTDNKPFCQKSLESCPFYLLCSKHHYTTSPLSHTALRHQLLTTKPTHTITSLTKHSH